MIIGISQSFVWFCSCSIEIVSVGFGMWLVSQGHISFESVFRWLVGGVEDGWTGGLKVVGWVVRGLFGGLKVGGWVVRVGGWVV